MKRKNAEYSLAGIYRSLVDVCPSFYRAVSLSRKHSRFGSYLLSSSRWHQNDKCSGDYSSEDFLVIEKENSTYIMLLNVAKISLEQQPLRPNQEERKTLPMNAFRLFLRDCFEGVIAKRKDYFET